VWSNASFALIRARFGVERANKVLLKPIGDHIAIVPRGMADTFFRAYLAVKECITPEQKTRHFKAINTEALLGMWMVRQNIKYDVQNWFWLLVRDSDGVPKPECHRVAYIGAEDRLSQDYLRRCDEFLENGVLNR
jgi:hypothetical protein